MCGILGVCWAGEPPYSEGQVAAALDMLTHRGPDDHGLQTFRGDRGSATLAHRRLSIIDLSQHGRQPITNEDGTVAVTFNGEVYNFRQLRDRLLAAGHRFTTDTDTEVLVHLYEEHGPAMVEHLRGMFAFAIFDSKAGRTLLARDRFGQKPLVYAEQDGALLFASEAKALLALEPALRTDLDARSLALYLTYQYVPHPRSIFGGLRKLPPGHLAVFEDGTLRVEPYWQAPFAEEDRSPRDWSEELRETLTEAVRLRMVSDVPIGAFLSGGVDSSITAGLMQSLSPEPIHTFSIGFPSKQYDETHYARMAAEKLGTRHHVREVTPSAVRSFAKLIWHYDEPFADSSAIPTLDVSAFAREHVTVALSGDGGDELFAGYNRYEAVRLAARIDRVPGLRTVFGSRLWQLLPASGRQKSLLRRARRFAEGMSATASTRYLRWISHFDPAALSDLFTLHLREQLGGWSTDSLIADAYALAAERDIATQTCAADAATYLPCDILTKVDTASMAASLEARSPFLDHRVAELAARMPIGLKMSGGRQKAVLVDTFKDLLPPPVQSRSKMGFGVPIDDWFRGELRPLLDDVLLSDRALSRGWFRPDAVREYVRQHVEGIYDQHYRLWNLLVFELWQRAWCDGHLPASPADVDLGLPPEVMAGE